MNKNAGVIGRKLGMTQLFDSDGSVIPCTVVQAKSIVVAKRVKDKDGYDALVLGSEPASDKHVRRPQQGLFKKSELGAQRVLREIRCTPEYAAKFEVGQALKLDEVFSEGQFVDVQSTTRGRGFSGVMRRHHFKGSVASHGSHEVKRHGGSIGTNMTPGRVYKGRKMAGQHGNRKVSIMNQRVVKVLADQDLILIRGGVPGAKNGLVVVRGAAKKPAPAAQG